MKITATNLKQIKKNKQNQNLVRVSHISYTASWDCHFATSFEVRLSKEGGLIREFSYNFKPTFYPCTVLRQPLPLPKGALCCRRPADECIVYDRTGGVYRDSSIIYDFLALAARLTVHAKIDSSGSYRIITIFGLSQPFNRFLHY